jgi:hypothetical protein
MSSERKEQKPSQAVAVCGESRTHGDNGGDGETQVGCALCSYPLRTGGTAVASTWCAKASVSGYVPPAAERGACVPCMRSCLGVKVSCPGVRGAEGQGKRKGVTARWGLKEA